MAVGVSECVGVALGDGAGVSVGASVSVNISCMVEAGTGDVMLNGDAVGEGVTGGAAGEEATPYTAPTMAKFAKMLAIRIAPTIRRAVIRMQIFFSQCIGHPYSSSLGHCSIGQNSNIPFLARSISLSAFERLRIALHARKAPSTKIEIKIAI